MATTTPHTNSVGQAFTLAAGNNSWASMLAAVFPGMALGHVSFSWIIESGGPVAWGKKVLTAAADGSIFGGVGEGDSENATQGSIIDGSQINFWDDKGGGGSVIFIRASNR